MTTTTSTFHVTSPPTIAAERGDLQQSKNTTGDPSPTGVFVSFEPSSVQPPSSEARPNQSMEDETEDEEVKMNCIGGLRGIQDSDMNTTDGDDEDDDDDVEDDEEEKDPDE